jgi:hypothetical protein
LAGTLAALAEPVVLLLLPVFLSTNLAVLVLPSDTIEEQHFRYPGCGTWVATRLMTQRSIGTLKFR